MILSNLTTSLADVSDEFMVNVATSPVVSAVPDTSRIFPVVIDVLATLRLVFVVVLPRTVNMELAAIPYSYLL